MLLEKPSPMSVARVCGQSAVTKQVVVRFKRPTGRSPVALDPDAANIGLVNESGACVLHRFTPATADDVLNVTVPDDFGRVVSVMVSATSDELSVTQSNIVRVFEKSDDSRIVFREVKREFDPEEYARGMRAYARMKQNILSRSLDYTALGTVVTVLGFQHVEPGAFFAGGGLCGVVYHWTLQKQVDQICDTGATQERARDSYGVARLVLLVGMLAFLGKNNVSVQHTQFLCFVAGFLVNKVAVYASGFE
jgi:hypothetical protein